MGNNLPQTTKIFVDWDFDIESDEQTQEMLGLSEGDIDVILADPERLEGYKSDVAKLFDVPQIVDLADFFENVDVIDDDQITDALSDEFGWLVNHWHWHDACNNDNTNGMITQQPQPINPMEDNMANSTTQTPNNEVSMSSSDLITQLFNQFTQDGGSPKVTEFKRHIDQLIKSDIKPLCGRTAKAADGTDWRSVLKAKFGGRGAKWVKLPVNNIEASLDKFDNDGVDTADYRAFINQAGFAWIRFAGPRVDNGVQAAAFEVRTGGSTIDHPKQLHYIPAADLDNIIEDLNGTPHSLKLEAIAKPEAAQEDDAQPEATEEVEVQDDTPTAEMLDEMIADINSFDEDNDEDLFSEL